MYPKIEKILPLNSIFCVNSMSFFAKRSLQICNNFFENVF